MSTEIAVVVRPSDLGSAIELFTFIPDILDYRGEQDSFTGPRNAVEPQEAIRSIQPISV